MTTIENKKTRTKKTVPAHLADANAMQKIAKVMDTLTPVAQNRIVEWCALSYGNTHGKNNT
jgi:hypothetical protein